MSETENHACPRCPVVASPAWHPVWPVLCLFAFAFGLVPAPGQGAAEFDVIARVGDQPIRLSEIDRMINSSNVIGLSLPPPGTKARNEVRVSLLDKMISANLLYLDALRRKIDRNPVYQSDVRRFAEATLVSLYREKSLIGDLPVTDQEIQDFYDTQIKPGTPFSADLHTAIEARLRKEKFKRKTADLSARLRRDVDVVIVESSFDPAKHPVLDEGDVVARVGTEAVTWAQAKPWLSAPKPDSGFQERLRVVNKAVDSRIAVRKAKAAGLEHDPIYLARVAEFSKARLINLRRAQLDTELAPDKDEIRAYFAQHKGRISVPERRKVQMVVVRTRAEAEALKDKIDAGKLTIFQAAAQYSIDPNASRTLGEMGWVSKGSGFPELDRFTFALKPGVLGGPVESPAGWHLVKVLDVRAPAFQDIDEKATWRKTRRMLLEERQNQYVIDLRKKIFPVEVYQDVFDRLLEQEAQHLQAKRDKDEAAQPLGNKPAAR